MRAYPIMNLAAPFQSNDEYLEVHVSNRVLFSEHLVTAISMRVLFGYYS